MGERVTSDGIGASVRVDVIAPGRPGRREVDSRHGSADG